MCPRAEAKRLAFPRKIRTANTEVNTKYERISSATSSLIGGSEIDNETVTEEAPFIFHAASTHTSELKYEI